jgi:hypothetical protein
MLGGQVVNILLSSDALALNDPAGKMADVVTRDFKIKFKKKKVDQLNILSATNGADGTGRPEEMKVTSVACAVRTARR